MDLEIGRILDLSPRTARRLVRLARAPEALATAFREGRITLLAAEAILRGAPLDETVTLRKLQERVQPEVDFWAPPDVARLFLAMVARMGLEGLLDHAIATWIALAQATRSSSATAGGARRRRAARGGTSTATTSSTAPTKDPTMRET